MSEVIGEPHPRAHRLLALLHQARAEEAACRGADARVHWTSAVAEWGAGQFGWQHANAWIRLGECQLRQGDRAAAFGSLQTARDLADEISARPLAEEADRLRTQAGLAPGDPTDGDGETPTATASPSPSANWPC